MWDEAFPARADPLGQASAPLPGVSACGLCLYHLINDLAYWDRLLAESPNAYTLLLTL